MEWVTDRDAITTILALGMDVGDQVRLQVPEGLGSANWTSWEDAVLELVRRGTDGGWGVRVLARPRIPLHIDPLSVLTWAGCEVRREVINAWRRPSKGENT